MTKPLIESLSMAIEMAHGELDSIQGELSSARYRLSETPWLFFMRKAVLRKSCSDKLKEVYLCRKSIENQEKLLETWLKETA